ncbi:MAG: type II toxin-antitoxin system RelE/ParE family toxin [Bacteroidetes bacterium]|nr:type II toxin-antitoxin system RelE/ParE family toxin [Bacteroidota bacterium]
MIYNVVISTKALEELYDSAEWYNSKKENLGFEFINEVDSTIDIIQTNPLLFANVYGNFRMALTNRFPFEIFYTIDNYTIVIHHIFHASRNPENWKK